jgi:hypothetical protein
VCWGRGVAVAEHARGGDTGGGSGVELLVVPPPPGMLTYADVC